MSQETNIPLATIYTKVFKWPMTNKSVSVKEQFIRSCQTGHWQDFDFAFPVVLLYNYFLQLRT